ncbi:MAG: 2-amino-4-hydroxy-6-hydroxymethyldihydropteridine diphosphokinase [Bacteroidota bacterium]
MTTVYLGLGSNIGNKLQYLTSAISSLTYMMNITATSSVYETEPVGFNSNDKFFNAVIKAETELSASDLLLKIKHIEHSLGRKAETHLKSREIDIDILFYGNGIYSDTIIEIPHPRMAERRFVLIPLDEIAPAMVHPVLHKSIRELLAECVDTSTVTRTNHQLTDPKLS